MAALDFLIFLASFTPHSLTPKVPLGNLTVIPYLVETGVVLLLVSVVPVEVDGVDSDVVDEPVEVLAVEPVPVDCVLPVLEGKKRRALSEDRYE